MLAPTSKAAAPLGSVVARIFVPLWLLIERFCWVCVCILPIFIKSIGGGMEAFNNCISQIGDVLD